MQTPKRATVCRLQLWNDNMPCYIYRLRVIGHRTNSINNTCANHGCTDRHDAPAVCTLYTQSVQAPHRRDLRGVHSQHHAVSIDVHRLQNRKCVAFVESDGSRDRLCWMCGWCGAMQARRNNVSLLWLCNEHFHLPSGFGRVQPYHECTYPRPVTDTDNVRCYGTHFSTNDVDLWQFGM